MEKTNPDKISSFRSSKKNRPQWILNIFITSFFILSGIVFSIQQVDFSLAVKQGLIIPDSVNMALSLENKWISGEIYNLDSDILSISILYGWTWLIHPIICYPINLALIYLSIQKFKKFAIEKIGAPPWSILGIILNPYLILATPGPNKEIPLLLLTILVCSFITNQNRGWLIGSTLLCIPIYFLRDGYGLFIFFCICTIFILGRHERLFSKIIYTTMIMTASLFGYISSLIPTLNRNIEIYESTFATQVATGAVAASFNFDPLSISGGSILFFFRLLYNALSLAIFPVTTTSDGEVYWIGVSYWISGFIILLTTSSSLITQITGKNTSRALYLLSAFVVSTWLMVSISLFVQPRYLMPTIPIAFLALSITSKKIRRLCIVGTLTFSISILLINTILSRLPPSASIEEFPTPAYIW